MAEANQHAAVADPGRAEGWVVTYVVEVIFDADAAGRAYDHVGTMARCQHCQKELNLRHDHDALNCHARTHQGELSIYQGTMGALSSTQEVIDRLNYPRR